MVILHTWLPTTPRSVLEGIRPDAGHSSLEIINDEANLVSYISYWPEPESLIGHMTELLKPRPHRHPETYALECDPSVGYMQRPSDHSDELHGLDEDIMIELWTAIRDTKYDLMHWNCSNISKLLILSAIDPTYHKNLETAAYCSPEDLQKISGPDDLFDKITYLATSPFIDCRPEDVRRMIEAYLEMLSTAIRTI
jgi:hypothetical protein